jgi:pyrimidine operon attenuation protein / uracil phosphoribosyltransferase
MPETKRHRLIMNAEDISRTIQRMAYQLWERDAGEKLGLVGIRSRGATLAKRLKSILESTAGCEIPFGILDIALYRDDIGFNAVAPEVRSTEIPFDIEGMKIILVDDVLYTGRTVRAALNALMDLGRPDSVELLTLIDREGLRELPIQSDFAGKEVTTYARETVVVHLEEDDGKDDVITILE